MFVEPEKPRHEVEVKVTRGWFGFVKSYEVKGSHALVLALLDKIFGRTKCGE